MADANGSGNGATGNGPAVAGPDHAETPPSGRVGTFASLAIPNLRYLWLGQLSHAGALWMEQIARPFLILELTDGSPTHVGAVIAVRTLPQLIFGVWAGVLCVALLIPMAGSFWVEFTRNRHRIKDADDASIDLQSPATVGTLTLPRRKSPQGTV